MPFDFALPSFLSLFTLRTALVRRKASGHSLLGATETDRADDCFFLRYPSPLFLPKTLISPRVLDTLLQQVAYLLLQCHLTILAFFPFFLTSYIIPCSLFSRFSSTCSLSCSKQAGRGSGRERSDEQGGKMTDLFIRCFASGIFTLLSCSLDNAVLSDTWTGPRLTPGLNVPDTERTSVFSQPLPCIILATSLFTLNYCLGWSWNLCLTR
jgi:hypothetical protein